MGYGRASCLSFMNVDVLDLFAAGLSAEQMLEEMPDLEADDLKASLLYASRKFNSEISAMLRLDLSLRLAPVETHQ